MHYFDGILIVIGSDGSIFACDLLMFVGDLMFVAEDLMKLRLEKLWKCGKQENGYKY